MSFPQFTRLWRRVFQIALQPAKAGAMPTAGTTRPTNARTRRPSPGPGAAVVSMTITVDRSRRARQRFAPQDRQPFASPHMRPWMPARRDSVDLRLRLDAVVGIHAVSTPFGILLQRLMQPVSVVVGRTTVRMPSPPSPVRCSSSCSCHRRQSRSPRARAVPASAPWRRRPHSPC